MENQFITSDDIRNLENDFEKVVKTLLESGELPDKKFSKWFRFIGFFPKKNKYELELKRLDTHEFISRKVFRRLLLRNAQLSLLTKLTFEQTPSESIKDSTSSKIFTNSENQLPNIDTTIEQGTINDTKTESYKKQSAYKHAITDLFVEKALAYLEEKANYYSKYGNYAYLTGLIFIIIGIAISGIQFYKNISDTNTIPNKDWVVMATHFISAFTFYGFIVIAAVGLWRVGRAMLDQAERLLGKRHALRQGRLFVHLQDRDLTIENMEKAFNWNMSDLNAFSHMLTEAKAPWGSILSEVIKASAEVAKNSKNSISNDKTRQS